MSHLGCGIIFRSLFAALSGIIMHMLVQCACCKSPNAQFRQLKSRTAFHIRPMFAVFVLGIWEVVLLP